MANDVLKSEGGFYAQMKMKSARYEDAAVFRDKARQSSSAGDLDTSKRGIEHFVFPELIRKKKRVQVQVMLFVTSE